MSFVQFEPDGLFFYDYSPKQKKDVRKGRVKRRNVLTKLREVCQIKEGTTLRDIFRTVGSYKLLTAVISQYSWCRAIEEFHAAAEEPPLGEEKNPLTKLEVYWSVSLHESKEKIKHPGGKREVIRTIDFELSPSFHGYGPPDEENIKHGFDADKDMAYGISFSPMWQLADKPVVLNKDFVIYEPTRIKNGKYEPPAELLRSTREYTLLEVLDAIYWEVSFHGGPAETAEKSEELQQRVEDIKSGNFEGIPMPMPEGVEPPKMKIILHPDVAKFFGIEQEETPDE